MSCRSRITSLAAGLVALLVAGCGWPGGPAHQAIATTAPATASAAVTSASSTMPAKSADPQLAAVTVARAFTAEICPYSYRDQVPYGQRLNAALTHWSTGQLVAAHRWSAAHIATAAAGLREHQAEQVCGQVTGGLDPEGSAGPGGVVLVRLSVTVTAHSATGPTSSAQQVFTFELARRGTRWLIDYGQW
jgi:hypothetical protein